MTRACIALPLLLAASASAQTTGSISGRIVDAQSARPVAGATVVASGPAQPGEESVRTDAGGEFVIALLPPGRYTLFVQAEAHQAFTQEGIEVSIGREVRLRLSILPDAMLVAPVRLRPDLPFIPSGTGRAGAVIAREQFELIPYGREQRSYESPVVSVPGVLVGPLRFYGSPPEATRYRIDGLDVNDPASALLGRRLLQRFVDQVVVETRALGAEYGRSSAGVVEAVTKSGSNDLHGAAFIDWMPLEIPRRTLRSDLDGGVELGGALEKNRAWFYAGFAPVLDATTTFGARTDYQYVGKLSWKPADGQTFVLSAISDDFALRYLGNVFDRSAQVEAITGWSHHGSSDSVQARATVSHRAELFGRHRVAYGVDTSRETAPARARWILGGFLQDTWSPAETLSLEAGLRIDRQDAPSATELLPRASIAWDFSGTGAARAWGFYGRFVDPAPLASAARLIENQVAFGIDREIWRDFAGGLGWVHKQFSGAPDGRTSFDALTLSLEKPFSAGALLRASYTLSSLRGPAPMPDDAPNAFKLDAGYAYEWDPRTTLTLGTSFRAIEASPWQTTIDARLGVVRMLPPPYVATLTVDVLNLLAREAGGMPPLSIRFGGKLSF